MSKPRRWVALFVLAMFSLQIAAMPLGAGCQHHASFHVSHPATGIHLAHRHHDHHLSFHDTAPNQTTGEEDGCQSDHCGGTCPHACHAFALSPGFLAITARQDTGVVTPVAAGSALPSHRDLPLRPPAISHA